MARPIPGTYLRDFSKFREPKSEAPPVKEKTLLDRTLDKLYSGRPSNNLVLVRTPVSTVPPPKTSVEPENLHESPKTPKPSESFKQPEDLSMFPERPTFITPKVLSHSPKISPSSIPNPSPSISSNKQGETGYPNYGGYLYSIPGYSAFQPVSYPGLPPPNPPAMPLPPEPEKPQELSSGFTAYPTTESNIDDMDTNDDKLTIVETDEPEEKSTKEQTDFEEQFTPEIIPATEAKSQSTECKLSVASLAQSSVTTSIQESKKKQMERFSLKTSIPISKIDMKCVNTPPDSTFQSLSKKSSPVTNEGTTLNSAFHNSKETTFSSGFQVTKDLSTFNPVFPSTKDACTFNPVFPSTKDNSTLKPAFQIPKDTSAFNPAFQATKETSGLRSSFSETKDTSTFNPAFPASKETNKLNTIFLGSKDANTLKTKYPVTKDVSTFTPVFASEKDISTRVEIQSNIVIKTATNQETEVKTTESRSEPIRITQPKVPTPPIPNNSISTLINAAEAISNSEAQFWKEENNRNNSLPGAMQTVDNEVKDTTFPKPATRPLFNPPNAESKINKPPDGFGEQKNQILFIQNKNPANPKMVLALAQQQSNPQVILQRTTYEPKNLLAPSRLSSLIKKNKEIDSTSSKVVALKRLHQENCDENDFENLITENQIYGNKIVVKEKSQGTLQEQDHKNNLAKSINDKTNQTTEAKNVVLQPNFLYLSNVQFPNLMMIKNNGKINQVLTDQQNKPNKIVPNENVYLNEGNVITSNDANANIVKNAKCQNIVVSKEMHVLKSSNNVLQTLPNKINTSDLVFQTNQKLIMNPQIVYQVPMIVESNVQKLNAPSFISPDYTKFISQTKKEIPRVHDQTISNEKLFIACPYQMDTKLQPKIVITNLRTQIAKVEEISSLDLYEKRKRIRRLNYLTSKETKQKEPKVDAKKVPERMEIMRDIITPSVMKDEISKEFANTKMVYDDDSSESESDGDQDELNEYESIIKKYGPSAAPNLGEKIEFLSNFHLGTHDFCKNKLLDRLERSVAKDVVASAYIAAGRIDKFTEVLDSRAQTESPKYLGRVHEDHLINYDVNMNDESDIGVSLLKKQAFLSHFQLGRVTAEYKEAYEKTWHEIINERRRREGLPNKKPHIIEPKPVLSPAEKMTQETQDQLQILTNIQNCVNENNNLIKRRLDIDTETNEVGSNGDSIPTLAKKNITELVQLFKMADQSVKILSGHDDARRRDQSTETIHKLPRLNQQSYQAINIPSLSKIIALKTTQEQTRVTTTQATSMDEPEKSAGGLVEEPEESQEDCDGFGKEQITNIDNDVLHWPGVVAIMKSYQRYEQARKREELYLERKHTRQRVESASMNRAAARGVETARTLLAECQTLQNDENSVRLSIQKLLTAVEVIKNHC